MGRSQQTFNKKEKEKKRLKKRKDKLDKAADRKANSAGGGLENMMAYVDENGVITDTPPDLTIKKEEIEAEDIVIGVPKKEYVEPEEMQGKVSFYNDSKGFGFINDLNSQDKFFFHVNGTLEEIVEGDKVTFDLEKGMKGMNDVRVKKI